MAAYAWMPNMAVYAGTKEHNKVLGRLVASYAGKTEGLKGLLDVQTLHPAGVSTNLTNFAKVGGAVVTADSCARGSLADLGQNERAIFGAMEHTILARLIFPLVAWSPDVNREVGFKRSKDRNLVQK